MKSIIISISALTLGLGLSACGGASEAAAPKAAAPATVTITAEPVTQTVTETPQACLDALDDAEHALGLARDTVGNYREFVKIAARYPDLMLRAVQAAATMDVAGINGVTADLKVMTADIKANNKKLGRTTTELGPVTSAYRTDSAACRASQ